MFNLLENPCSFFEHFLSHPGGISVIALSVLGGLSGIVNIVEKIFFPIIRKNKSLEKATIKFCKDYLAGLEEKNEKNEKTPENGV